MRSATGGSGCARRDLAKIGQLYLDQGWWQGRRLVPDGWIRQATSNQSSLSVTGPGPVGGYGFGWWIRSAGSDPAFAALGFGGQMIAVVPALRLVVVTAVDVDYDDAADHGVDVDAGGLARRIGDRARAARVILIRRRHRPRWSLRGGEARAQRTSPPGRTG